LERDKMAIPRPFPNESDAYRSARNELLAAEVELRRQGEHVAALRRELPLGGAPPEDYAFSRRSSGQTNTVALSELFGDHDTLVLYNFMYSPDMKNPCGLCTALLDSLDGAAEHAGQRLSLVVVASSPIDRVLECAAARNWDRLRFVSSHGTTFEHDYLAQNDKAFPWPIANVFVRRDGEVRHFWSSELFYSPGPDGTDARHVDSIWPLWNLFDLTPEGRGTDWYPRLIYRTGA
jgi:predicted dithiol-disulfide oxidoreductase (DUF899 family)